MSSNARNAPSTTETVVDRALRAIEDNQWSRGSSDSHHGP